MMLNLRSIFNVLFILFGLYTLYSLWTAPLSKNNGLVINTIPSNSSDLPPNAIPLGTKIKEVWDHDPNGPSKATSEEFYYNPNNTGMYYDHQYWMDNEVFCQ